MKVKTRNMSVITRVIIAIACLIAASACYALGVPAGGVVFLLLGILFEGLFWFNLFGKKKERATVVEP